jgi:hypothetical protein
MNPRELVDHIRSGPAKLVLEEPLRCRRRTRSNPCGFNEFLQALLSSETILTVMGSSHRELGISEDEWVLLVEALESNIKGIESLILKCEAGSRDFCPFQAIAEAVSNARSLRKLEIYLHGPLPRDPSGMIALANALREHTAWNHFAWLDSCDWLEARHGVSSVSPDFVLRVLPACSHLRHVTIQTKCASADAVTNLLQLQSATSLRLFLETDQWLAVTDEIRHGRCNVKKLTLIMLQTTRWEATEATKAIASAIRLDRNLKRLTLEMENDFTDEAGVVLAEVLTVNKNLRKITLNADPLLLSNHCPIKMNWVHPPMRHLVQCFASKLA